MCSSAAYWSRAPAASPAAPRSPRLAVSGFGSGMGAAIRRQLRSEAVRRRDRGRPNALTCSNVVNQPLCSPEYLVRDREAVCSDPGQSSPGSVPPTFGLPLAVTRRDVPRPDVTLAPEDAVENLHCGIAA